MYIEYMSQMYTSSKYVQMYVSQVDTNLSHEGGVHNLTVHRGIG